MFGRNRCKAVIISALSAFVFASCGGKGILVKAPELNVPFEADVKIQAGELEIGGNMKRYGTGIWEMSADSPETLAGLELSYSDEGVAATLDDLRLDIPAEKIRDGAVFAQIFKAMDSAAAAGELVCTETEDGKVFSGEFSGGAYSIVFEPETLVPVSIEIPSAGIFAELENFRLTAEESTETETKTETKTE